MSVAQAQRTISSAEFTEWQAFALLEPFGSHVEDLRALTGPALLANVHRDAKARPEPFAPLDFAPWNAQAQAQAAAPVRIMQLDDAQAQSELIDKLLFGLDPENAS
jgi:hypothetical protein